MEITTKLEFDAGHRIPNHKSKCRNLHGHRYVMEITLRGDIVTEEKVSENGMVMDFSDVKRIAREQVVDVWDHAFLVYKEDSVYGNQLTLHRVRLYETPNSWADASS